MGFGKSPGREVGFETDEHLVGSYSPPRLLPSSSPTPPASSTPSPVESATVLCVDLDDTLVLTDTLWESALIFVRQRPLLASGLFLWALRGPTTLKRELSRRVQIEPAHLPYHQVLLARLREEAAQQRKLVLVSAAHESIVSRVAEHLGLFTETLATTDTHNLKGPNKATALRERFGPRGFDYVGNGAVDLPVWEAARKALVTNAPAAVERAAVSRFQAEVIPLDRPQPLKAWFRGLRCYQWTKNMLLFVPLFAGHRFQPETWMAAALAFLAFSLCASGVYVVNDLLDLEADRQHPTKRRRPFAAGALSIPAGVFATAALFGGSALACAFLPAAFRLTLALYLAVTTWYSLTLKRKVIIDVICLAALYMTRVIAGGAATAVPLSSWFLGFTVFLFVGLGMVKRLSELRRLVEFSGKHIKGRGYLAEDLPIIAMLGIASSYVAVLVFALYLNSPEVLALYERPIFLWGICIGLLYWISRVWLLANRGHLHDDPVVFALRDRTSYAFLAGLAVCLALAQPR